AEGGELFRLQQLVVEIARLVLEPLALADVAHERLDPQAARFVGVGVRGDFHPDRNLVGAAEAQQVIGERAVALQPRDEGVAGLRIDEPIAVERPDLTLGRVGGEAEHQLQVWIGRERARDVAGDRADVDAFVDRLEQPRERLDRLARRPLHSARSHVANVWRSGALSAPAHFPMGGVGVIVWKCGRYLASMPARIAVNAAPDAYPCIASRATSRQIVQPMPCGSQAVTRPRSSRAATKQSSL